MHSTHAPKLLNCFQLVKNTSKKSSCSRRFTFTLAGSMNKEIKYGSEWIKVLGCAVSWHLCCTRGGPRFLFVFTDLLSVEWWWRLDKKMDSRVRLRSAMGDEDHAVCQSHGSCHHGDCLPPVLTCLINEQVMQPQCETCTVNWNGICHSICVSVCVLCCEQKVYILTTSSLHNPSPPSNNPLSSANIFPLFWIGLAEIIWD